MNTPPELPPREKFRADHQRPSSSDDTHADVSDEDCVIADLRDEDYVITHPCDAMAGAGCTINAAYVTSDDDEYDFAFNRNNSSGDHKCDEPALPAASQDCGVSTPVQSHLDHSGLNQRSNLDKSDRQRNRKSTNGGSNAIPDNSRLLEDLVGELGGFGRYQVLLMSAMFGAKMSVSYNVLLMAFAAATPDWWCLSTLVNNNDDVGNASSGGANWTEAVNQCEVNGSQCREFRFSSSIRTVVSEWDLVCEQHWITSTITAVQMAGLFVGAAGAGQLADVWGRRNTVYLTLLVQAVFSLAAGFCTSWHLFTACRFFAGLASGGFVVVYFSLPMEFLGPQWRSVLSAIPTWSLGVGVLSLVAWLSHDWRWLSWIGGAFSAVFLLAYPFTPESVRWLVLHNRMEEAEKAIQRVVIMNRKPMPDLEVIRKVARREVERENRGGRKYTYLDLFKGWRLVRSTLCFSFTWFSSGLVYYILSFGVEQLSGNLYLNMFLLSVVEIPGMLVTTVLNNRLGRRWTSFLFFAISCVTAIAVVIITYVARERNTAVSVLVLLCKLGLATAWPCVQLFASESFPTVVRSVGYGTCNVASRVGGIIAPYLVLLGTTQLGVLYIIVSVVMAASAVVCLLCAETKGRALDDTIAEFLDRRDADDVHDKTEHGFDT